MLQRASRGRAALTGLALVLALALVGLGGWYLSSSPRPRGTPAAAPGSAAPAQPPQELPAPAAETLVPAAEATRSTLATAQESAPARASARLVVRVTQTGSTRAGRVTITLVEDGGRAASEFELAPERASLEIPCSPGDVKVSARGDGPPRVVSMTVHATLQPGASELVELVLAPEAVFAGALEDETGRALEGLALHLRRRKEVLASATSDVAGRFRLAALPAGEYELVLGALEGPLRPPETVVLAPDDPPRTLVLPVLLALGLRVVDADGHPVAGARLEGTGKPGGHLQGLSDADGRLRVEGLPPGDYRVFARHATLGRATRALVLDARTSADEHELVLHR